MAAINTNSRGTKMLDLTTPELVTYTAQWLGIDRSFVDSCGRYLRESDYDPPLLIDRGRGLGAKTQDDSGKINVFLASCGTSVAKRAPTRVFELRGLTVLSVPEVYPTGLTCFYEGTFGGALLALFRDIRDNRMDGAFDDVPKENRRAGARLWVTFGVDRHYARISASCPITIPGTKDGRPPIDSQINYAIEFGHSDQARQSATMRYAIEYGNPSESHELDFKIPEVPETTAGYSKLYREIDFPGLAGWSRCLALS
jgi:hypothetical protein